MMFCMNRLPVCTLMMPRSLKQHALSNILGYSNLRLLLYTNLQHFGLNHIPLPLSQSKTNFKPNERSNQIGDRGEYAKLPAWEMVNLNEDPTAGYKLKFQFRYGDVFIYHTPQNGPRALDPHNSAPQWDSARTSKIRIRLSEITALLCVMENTVPQVRLKSEFMDLSFSSEMSETKHYLLKGAVRFIPDHETKSEWSVKFEKSHVNILYHFLNNCLDSRFGFENLYNSKYNNKSNK